MKKAFIAALVFASIAGIVLYSGSDSPESSPAAETAAATPSSSSSIPSGDAAAASAPSPSESPGLATDPNDAEEPSCPDFRPDPSHPWFLAEMARLQSLGPSGPGMAVYRGLGEADLKSLAAQRDSGAMIVLGKRAELRAEGKPEDDAVGQLDGQSMSTRSWSMKKDLEEDVRAALVEAEYWYYQGVLHGRLFAMFHVGVLRERLGGGPVELGWVDEDTFADMDSNQRADYYPAVVYGAAATTLAPEVVQSPMLTLALDGLDMTMGDPATIELVVTQLRADLQQNGLTLPDIPPYEGPGIDEWREEFCRD